MSKIEEAFQRVKTAVDGAFSLADPEQALKEAHHGLLEVLAATITELRDVVHAIDQRVNAIEIVLQSPVKAADNTVSEVKSVVHQLGEFVEHLIHPDAGVQPPAQSAQPEVAKNTGSDASPVAPSTSASNSALTPGAEGVASPNAVL